ncbi:hypothetical protein [Leucobacter tenebrionis]|uniref:hypothetical protein n=1 Tax=Leucobacter tenebrionis TaxID=2873270 RepID=UPI001CA6CC11|nr:hypothetical protein [Leucobacter tenebrionis]QZY52118.1 hypothetical protein KVY00_01180 [Leucobacter tenebrionis]
MSTGEPRDSRSGAAAALAGRLERICCAGIELRQWGSCAPPDGGTRRRARHRHDRGCRTLGLPLHLLERSLRRWDTVGAAGLLLEAVAQAVAEVEAHGEPWSARRATEALAYALHGRITPRAAATGRGGRGP